MHAEPWRGVDLDDAAARLGDRASDVRRQEVDAGDVQAHDRGRAPRDHGVGGMDHIGPIDGRTAGRQVGRVPQPDDAARLRRTVQGQAFCRQPLAHMGVDHDAGHHGFMPDASPRICIHLLDQ